MEVEKWDLRNININERNELFMLWIATQDDRSLINAKEITIDGKEIEGVMGSSAMDHWAKTLGTCESNERALEVRNEILTKIEESNSFFVTYIMPEK